MARGRPSRATVHARLDSQIAELRTRLGGLPSPEESAYAWTDIWHLEAHHSTALEGNTLVLREVDSQRGRAREARPHCGPRRRRPQPRRDPSGRPTRTTRCPPTQRRAMAQLRRAVDTYKESRHRGARPTTD